MLANHRPNVELLTYRKAIGPAWVVPLSITSGPSRNILIPKSIAWIIWNCFLPRSSSASWSGLIIGVLNSFPTLVGEWGTSAYPPYLAKSALNSLDLLESFLESNLLRYIVFFEYVAQCYLNLVRVPERIIHLMDKPDLKIEIRNYEFSNTKILTTDEYVDTCEGYDYVTGREDWVEMEYLSGDHRVVYACL